MAGVRPRGFNKYDHEKRKLARTNGRRTDRWESRQVAIVAKSGFLGIEAGRSCPRCDSLMISMACAISTRPTHPAHSAQCPCSDRLAAPDGFATGPRRRFAASARGPLRCLDSSTRWWRAAPGFVARLRSRVAAPLGFKGKRAHARVMARIESRHGRLFVPAIANIKTASPLALGDDFERIGDARHKDGESSAPPLYGRDSRTWRARRQTHLTISLAEIGPHWWSYELDNQYTRKPSNQITVIISSTIFKPKRFSLSL